MGSCPTYFKPWKLMNRCYLAAVSRQQLQRGFVRAHQASSHTPSCFPCHQEHPLFQCPAFLVVRPADRAKKAPYVLAPRTKLVEHLHKRSCAHDYLTKPIRVEQSAFREASGCGEQQFRLLRCKPHHSPHSVSPATGCFRPFFEVLVTGIGDSRAGLAKQSATFSVEPWTDSQPGIHMTALM
ncbi:hypothetical protein KM043_017526 [Ampulex compressa]|nr:hypothetical protein KM043_017526 [Ampulex compressa]